MARIVSIGRSAQNIYLADHDDLFFAVPVGAKLDIDKIAYTTGGSGLNAALTFAKFGHETILISDIANDSAGEVVLAALDDEGVDNSYIGRNHTTTETSVILLNSQTAERTVLSCRGRKKPVTYDATDLDLIHPHWLYASSLDGDMDTLRCFFEHAHQNGIKVAFNPGPAELAASQKLIGLLEDVDVLIVNKAEASSIVPGAVLTELLSHLNNYVGTVIITAGAMGGIATDGHDTYRFGIYEDVVVKDTTNAGDAFAAGFLAHYTAHRNFKQALIFASANATTTVQTLGYDGLTGRETLHDMPIQQL